MNATTKKPAPRPREQLVSRAQLARGCGVSEATITNHCKPGKRLAPAVTGKHINALHPAVTDYLTKRGVTLDAVLSARQKRSVEGPPAPALVERKPAGRRGMNETRKAEQEGDPLAVIPENIQAYADLTLREIINTFGTDYRFKDYLTSLKSIEDIQEKRVRNAASAGRLVSRDLVQGCVIDPIERAHVQLLGDGVKTITRRMHDMVKAGKTVEECEQFVSDQITSFIRPLKRTMIKALQEAATDEP